MACRATQRDVADAGHDPGRNPKQRSQLAAALEPYVLPVDGFLRGFRSNMSICTAHGRVACLLGMWQSRDRLSRSRQRPRVEIVGSPARPRWAGVGVQCTFPPTLTHLQHVAGLSIADIDGPSQDAAWGGGR